jgi:uncharacterized membrane protein YfcA
VDLTYLEILGAIGILIGALSSGLIGVGFPVIAVPLMAVGYGLDAAVVILTLPTLAIDVVNLWSSREHRLGTSALSFTFWAIVGAAIGIFVREELDERVLMIVLATVLTLYLVTQVFKKIDLRGAARHPVTQVSAGSLAGLFQSTIGVSGPIVGIFYINRTTTREAFIFSAAVTFTVSGAVRATGLTLTGAFTSPRLMAGTIIMVVALGLRALGAYFGSRMDVRGFRRAFTGILAVSLFFLVLKIF